MLDQNHTANHKNSCLLIFTALVIGLVTGLVIALISKNPGGRHAPATDTMNGLSFKKNPAGTAQVARKKTPILYELMLRCTSEMHLGHVFIFIWTALYFHMDETILSFGRDFNYA